MTAKTELLPEGNVAHLIAAQAGKLVPNERNSGAAEGGPAGMEG